MSIPPAIKSRVLFRYLTKEISVSILWSIIVIILILMPGFAIRAAYHFEFNGIGRITTLYILPTLLPQSLMLAIPLGAMIGTLLVFSRMQASGEILAIRAGGGSFKLFVRPTLVVGAVLTLLYLLLVSWGLDYSYSAMTRIVRNRTYDVIVSQLKPGCSYRFNFSKPGSGTDDDESADENHFLLLTLLPKTDAGKKPVNISVFNTDHSLDGKGDAARTKLDYSIIAQDHLIVVSKNETGLPSVITLTLKGVRQTLHRSNPDCIISMEFDTKTATYHFGAEMDRKSSLPLGRSMMSVGQNIDLAYQYSAEAAKYKAELKTIDANRSKAALTEHYETSMRNVKRYQSEVSRKVVTAFAIPLLMLLGIGFALMVSKSSPFIGFVAGLVGFGLFFFPLLSIGMQLGKTGLVNAWIAPGLTMLALLPLAVYLIRLGLMVRTPNRLFTLLSDWLEAIRKRKPKFDSAGLTPTQINLRQEKSTAFIRRRLRWVPGMNVASHHLTMSFLIPFVGACVGVMLIFIGVDFIDNIERVFGYLGDMKNAVTFSSRLQVVIEYYLLRGAFWGLQFGLISIIIGAVMSVVVAKQNGEMIILRAAGCSLQRAYLPMIIIATLIASVFSGLNELGGKYLERAERIKRWQMRDRFPPTADGFSIVQRTEDGMTMLIPASFDNDSRTINGFTAYSIKTIDGGVITRYNAPLAIWDDEKKLWRFPNGGSTERFQSMSRTDVDGSTTSGSEPFNAGSDFGFSDRVQIETCDSMSDAATPEMAQFKQAGVSNLSLLELSRLSNQYEETIGDIPRGQLSDRALLNAEIHQRITAFFVAPIALLICLSFLFRTESRSTIGGIGTAILLCGVFIAGRPAIQAVAGMASAQQISSIGPAILIWGYILIFGGIATRLISRPS